MPRNKEAAVECTVEGSVSVCATYGWLYPRLTAGVFISDAPVGRSYCFTVSTEWLYRVHFIRSELAVLP